MKEYTLPIAFLLAPFLILSTGYIWTGQQIGLMVIFLVLMAIMVENKWLRMFLLYAIAWQTILFITAMIYPQTFQSAIASGYTQTLFMVAGAMIYLTASRSKIALPVFYNVICVGALIQTGISLLQFGGIDIVPMVLSLVAPAQSKLLGRPIVGTLGNPNYLAAFLAFSLPFFFRRYWILMIPLVVTVLIVSLASAAVIPALVGCGVFVAMKYRGGWKRIIPIIIVAVTLIASYVVFDKSPTFVDRFRFWVEAFNQVIKAPGGVFFGLGPGAAWANNWPLHSEWVTLFHQFGLIGVLLAIGYILNVSRGNVYLFSSFVIVVINMFGNATMHIAPTAFLACLVAGLMEKGEI